LTEYVRGQIVILSTQSPIAILGIFLRCELSVVFISIARADCTEIVPRANYTAYQDEETGFLIVEPDMDTFYLEYKACEGYEYKADFTPETYAENGNRGLRRKNNDLSAYVFRQYLEGKKSFEETEAFEETIIGYKDPNVNRGDNQREAACKKAFEERYPDVEWAEKSQEEK
jgi:hypothetical protein